MGPPGDTGSWCDEAPVPPSQTFMRLFPAPPTHPSRWGWGMHHREGRARCPCCRGAQSWRAGPSTGRDAPATPQPPYPLPPWGEPGVLLAACSVPRRCPPWPWAVPAASQPGCSGLMGGQCRGAQQWARERVGSQVWAPPGRGPLMRLQALPRPASVATLDSANKGLSPWPWLLRVTYLRLRRALPQHPKGATARC
ncbi:threonyl-tRNA synthetase [Platysternon megacephalum]|uniref:Threonyl-tRNA synthetase n=1 Tax=Platysternon megacephalum TaxID=55544 RepID=A0A4D9DEV4_9SAUR|nr:threonyl-tRNA synthetase [Platysternon megacephalum]